MIKENPKKNIEIEAKLKHFFHAQGTMRMLYEE
jgi:hypothetical protein